MKNEQLSALLARAKAQMDNGEWAAALESCWVALAEDRNCSEAMYRLGEIHADARCPMADAAKAVYWFDASYNCAKIYTDPETGEDGWDRMAALFQRECCPDLDRDKMEERFFRAIELMRNISPVNEVICNVRELFENIPGSDMWNDDPDAATYLIDLSAFDKFTRPLPGGHTANNFFDDDDDFPWTAKLKCDWLGDSIPVPGEIREVTEKTFWREADENLRPGISRVVVYEEWEPRIVECWNEVEEQLEEHVIRHTVRVMRVRRLEDYIVRPADGKLPPLKQTMYLPDCSGVCPPKLRPSMYVPRDGSGVILDGHSADRGLSELRWFSYDRIGSHMGHESYWRESGSIFTYVDDDGVEYQLATTCVADNWMCFGSRALWVKAEHDAEQRKKDKGAK